MRYRAIKIATSFLAFIMILSPIQMCFADTALTATDVGKETKKVINIVYDDSGSMVNGEEKDTAKKEAYVATWSQAKYSLEAFVAMMNDDDQMNVYCMSDAGKLSKTIKGSDKDGGVDDIHSNLKTGDYSVLTPIQTLEKAYSGLSDSKYDGYEKWLVVLTDGAFTVSNKDGTKVSDTKVKGMLKTYGTSLKGRLIYIPIGSSAKEYKDSQYKTFKASTGDELLSQVKKAIESIYYGRNKQELTETTVNIGVSMKKIIIFAQGEGVEIESVSKGKITDNISVKYTDAENAVKYGGSPTFSGHEDYIKTDNSLQGVVVTVEPNGDAIEPGQLNIVFDEKVPKSYTIYYEPLVKAYYSLTKGDVEYISSEHPTDGGSLSPGTYKLTAYVADAFQKDESGKPVDVSDVNEIQAVKFDINLSGDGVNGGSQSFTLNQLKNGADVSLVMGSIDCKGDASILDEKYAVDTSALSNAFGGITVKDTYRLEIAYVKPTSGLLSYRFKKTNFTLHQLKSISKQKDMIKVIVTCYDNNGNKVDITEEQWAKVNAQNIKIYNGEDTFVQYDTNAFDFQLEDGNGVFYLCPQYWTENDKVDKKKTTHTNYLHGKRFCEVRTELNMDISSSLAYSTLGSSVEQKSTTYEIALCVWHTIVTIIIILWFAGYVFKKKLPKKKSAVAKNTDYYMKELQTNGKYEWVPQDSDFLRDEVIRIKVKPLTKWIPYITQVGTVNFKISGFPVLKIKGTQRFGKRLKVRLLNPASNFANVNGSTSIDDDNRFISTARGSITEEFLSSRKKFEFNMKNMSYGGDFGDDSFKTYEELSFK